MITLGLSGVNGVIVSRLVANFDSVNANQTIHLIATYSQKREKKIFFEHLLYFSSLVERVFEEVYLFSSLSKQELNTFIRCEADIV